MSEQMELDLVDMATQVREAFADGRLLVEVDEKEHAYDPYRVNIVARSRARGAAVRFVHVISRPAGGEIRGYAMIGGTLYLRLPNYVGAWPEVDAEVSQRLGLPVVAEEQSS